MAGGKERKKDKAKVYELGGVRGLRKVSRFSERIVLTGVTVNQDMNFGSSL